MITSKNILGERRTETKQVFNLETNNYDKENRKDHIIDAPTENVLTDNELLDFLGGDNCGSYDDSSCMWNKKTSCVEFSGGTACDGVEDAVKCGTYTTDPTIVN